MLSYLNWKRKVVMTVKHENKFSRWKVGAHFYLWQINISEHELSHKKVPFKIMWGIEPKVGLAPTVITPIMLGNIKTEEYLDTILQNEAQMVLMKRNKKERRNRKEKRNMMEKRSRNSLKLGMQLATAGLKICTYNNKFYSHLA